MLKKEDLDESNDTQRHDIFKEIPTFSHAPQNHKPAPETVEKPNISPISIAQPTVSLSQVDMDKSQSAIARQSSPTTITGEETRTEAIPQPPTVFALVQEKVEVHDHSNVESKKPAIYSSEDSDEAMSLPEINIDDSEEDE